MGAFSNDLAIDLGTANTLVLIKGQGISINEPSVVAIQVDRHGQEKILAVGQEAKDMVGKTPGNIKAIRPLKEKLREDPHEEQRKDHPENGAKIVVNNYVKNSAKILVKNGAKPS